jgi:beta-lactamase superfamily II metal-dependent hydrolase
MAGFLWSTGRSRAKSRSFLKQQRQHRNWSGGYSLHREILMRSPVLLRTVLSAGIILILVTGIFSAGCTGVLSGGTGSSLRANTTGDLRAYFLDVGQGDSSVILFKDKVILIDAGEVDQGERVVSDLQKLGVTQIDLLVATHPHADHIGGMQTVLAHFPVNKVLDLRPALHIHPVRTFP